MLMEIPPMGDPKWFEIVSGAVKHNFSSLSVNVFLMKLEMQRPANPTPRFLFRFAEELRELFVKSKHIPTVQTDLKKILMGAAGEKKSIFTPDEVREKIAQGKKMWLAGDENALKELPKGDWVGGTIPYFMTDEGGLYTRHKIHVTEMPGFVSGVDIKAYDEKSLPGIYEDAPANGFTYLIVPAGSKTLLSFAMEAAGYAGYATKPLIGWVSGVELSDVGSVAPKTFNGPLGGYSDNKAIAMHVSLPPGKYAGLGILNIFQQSNGAIITFPEDGFTAKDVYVNGVKQNFAEYMAEKQLDAKIPLIADYNGVKVNISLQSVDEVKKEVRFYAPFFKNIQYRHGSPINDYVKEFVSQMPVNLKDNLFFSCNCILNYLYSGLEGKKTGGITGPITFGEIAYQLLNQTLVYMTINDV